MQLRPRVLFAIILLSGQGLRAAQSQGLLFTIPANSTTTVVMTSTKGKGDDLPGLQPNTSTATYTGTIQADIDFDASTLEISEFDYTGGYVEVREDPVFTQIAPALDYGTPKISVISRYSWNFDQPYWTYRGFTPRIINPPASVISGTGEIVGNLSWETDAGFERIYNGYTKQVVKMDAINPLTPEFKSHRATPTITLNQTSETDFIRNIRATLTWDFNVVDTYDMLLTPDQVIVIETGSWSATSNFTLPTYYGQWAIDNGLNNPDPEGTNEAGIPNVFLYSLDLPGDASTLPISVVPVDNFYQVQIVLPESGLKTAMKIEYSFSMADGTWQELSPFFYPSPDALDVGATGSPTFPFPLPGRCFMRFVTEL